MIHTAGCIIIGDEVLGGKTVDTNSAYFAKFCFKLGISLKRIEVIADDEGEIVEAVRRMSSSYDFVVTSGGIGPTYNSTTPLRADAIANKSQARRYHLPVNSTGVRSSLAPSRRGLFAHEAAIAAAPFTTEL